MCISQQPCCCFMSSPVRGKLHLHMSTSISKCTMHVMYSSCWSVHPDSSANKGLNSLCTHTDLLHRYDAIIDLTRKLNSKYKHPQQTQAATKRILKSLFPGWLPPAFSVSTLAMHMGSEASRGEGGRGGRGMSVPNERV